MLYFSGTLWLTEIRWVTVILTWIITRTKSENRKIEWETLFWNAFQELMSHLQATDVWLPHSWKKIFPDEDVRGAMAVKRKNPKHFWVNWLRNVLAACEETATGELVKPNSTFGFKPEGIQVGLSWKTVYLETRGSLYSSLKDFCVPPVCYRRLSLNPGTNGWSAYLTSKWT